jgi:uncharacterized protein (TIGR02099 family)
MIKKIVLPAWVKRYAKRVWITFAVLVVLFAIALSVFRALTPWAAQHKDSLEARLSTLIGTSVSIQDMKTSWYWFEPVLKLDGVMVSEQGASVLEVKELLVGVDLIRSLWHWRIQPGVLFVEDARLHFREQDAHWQLEGLVSKTGVKVAPSTEYASLLDWLLAHQKIVMKRVGVTLHWEDGRLTRIKPLNAEAANHDGHYRVKGHASLDGQEPSELSLLADLDISHGFSTDVQGHAFISAERVVLAEWRTFLNKLGCYVNDGRGEIQLWFDVRNTRPVAVQSAVRLRDVVWQYEPQGATRNIDRFSANMAWEETADGWRGTADRIRLKANKTTWPENAIHVNYTSDTKAYRVFVKTMLLEPMRQFIDDDAARLKPFFALSPRGQLNNTQFGFQEGKLNYVLSRFSHMSWQANDTLPGVKKLSGAVAWEPEEGRLELDGEDVTLVFKNKPPLQFDLVNAAVMWKNLSHGWRVTLDRSILKHEHGVFSARGMLDGVSSQSKGNLQGDISFATHEATFWWPYLPANTLKPKLLAWIKNDVTRIEQASGHIQLEGAREDFPFDASPGVFLVTSSVSGVDLRFNHDWPLTKTIDANVRLDKRTLTADVTQADFQGIPMTEARLTVRDLGLNKEVLSVTGKAEAPCDDMLAYIKASPLHERLSKLDALIIKQPAMLTLALNFPFYPGPDKLTVQGEVNFQKNSLFLREMPTAFGLHELEGDLKFDEHGVLDSRLSARLLDESMSLWVRSNHGDEPHLAIDLDGYLSTTGLSQAVSFPALPLLRGRVPLKSHIIITDEPNDLDHVRLTTSLEGLAIKLPEPFGKKRAEVVPLSVDAYFNLERGMRLKIDYKQRFSTDLWYDGRPGALQLARGEVVLGTGNAVLRDKPGASIRGQFKTFDWPSWQAALAHMTPVKQRRDSLQGFRSIALTLGDADVFGQHYHNMHLHAQRLPDAQWSVAMKEDVVSADLKYDAMQHALKGYISQWVMPKPDITYDPEAKAPVKTVWDVRRIPNLKLKLGALQIGDVNAGQLSLKGTRLDDDAFRFDTSELRSDTYTLTFSGDWQASPKNETRVDARLQIHDLEKMLEHWHISPVVEAREGDIQLHGIWDAAPNDFSMKAITGKMHMEFKDGRITHLSPETEQKIGLGKLLSILSLQTIPRRLKLDFSDLSKPGYSFDKFEGNFVLAHGIMETEDSMIDGPVAHATMKGSLNLDKQLYDLSLHISPHITASLPVVATIAGGPIAGLATWVASKLINQGMEKISGYTYEVSGPWLEPVVQQVHIYKKQLPPREEIINVHDVKGG